MKSISGKWREKSTAKNVRMEFATPKTGGNSQQPGRLAPAGPTFNQAPTQIH
jgi:hypothetical protein